MIILTSKVVLEHIGPDVPDDEFDDFVQDAIDIMDEALENAKAIIKHNIKIEYRQVEQFEVSVM